MDNLTDLLLIHQQNKHKIYHLEALFDDFAYIGTDIRANSLDEAESILKSVFGSRFPEDPMIFCLSEDWIH